MDPVSIAQWLAIAEKLISAGVNLLPTVERLGKSLQPGAKPLTAEEWAAWRAEEAAKEEANLRPFPEAGV